MSVPIAIVGLGRWAAQHHCRALAAHPDAVVVAVVDPDPAKRRAAPDLLGDVAVFDTTDALWASGPAVAGVVVASPAAAHHAAALSALSRGVGVLVEKPMTTAPGDSLELVRAARATGALLMVGYPFQFSPVTRWVRDHVGELGGVTQVDAVVAVGRRHLLDGDASSSGDLQRPQGATYLDPARGGGQCRTELVHVLASVVSVLPDRPCAATALLHHGGRAVDAGAAGLLRLASGASWTFVTSGLLPPGLPEQRVVTYLGERGVLVHDLGAGHAVLRTEGRPARCSPVCPEYPSARPVREFVEILSGSRTAPSSAPAELGHDVDLVVDALYRSAAAGGGWVGIDAPYLQQAGATA